MTEGENMVERAKVLAVSFGARMLRGAEREPGVFEQLGITFTREEWAAFNDKAGTDYPYPFADVIHLRTALSQPNEEGEGK